MKRRKKTQAKSPLIRLVGLETAVVAVGLAGSVAAVAAPGDLDPSFGDVGRQTNIQFAPYSRLWSVDVQSDESVLFSGGGEYQYYENYYEESFVVRLLPQGAPDAAFAPAILNFTAVYDTTLQPDGKVVGVGTARQADGRQKLVVFRMRPNGSLDPEFGLGGQVLISDGSATREVGLSVVVDPDGRIVVAGQRADRLLVARLLTTGALDAGFGTAGVFVANGFFIESEIHIASAPAGGYRIAGNFYNDGTAPDTNCGVAGLSAVGVLDAAFGSGGYAMLRGATGDFYDCTAMVVQADGRIVLGGRDLNRGNGYVGRLLANGAVDTGFTAGMVPSRFGYVSALAAGATGSIYVAGTDQMGFSGAQIVRLLGDGSLDTQFGRAGTTHVAIKSRRTASVAVSDMKVLGGGRLVVGGNSYSDWESKVFVARLLGDGTGAGPGVLGIKQSRTLGTEQTGKVVLSVQRTGGSSGPVAVTYSTRDFPLRPAEGSEFAPGAPANSGADYSSTTGRLTWADGDVGEREIVVPLASDADAEPPEFFEVVLESPEGGAGLGTFGADGEIAGASYPFGDLSIGVANPTVNEFGQADFYVQRNYYSAGAVSVTVRVAAGSSAMPGQDFQNIGSTTWKDVVLTWADGDNGVKHLPISIVLDSIAEPAEVLTLELTSPTGGAALGNQKQATVEIVASTAPPVAPPPPPKTNSGGGGSFGWFGAMLLGLWGAFRRSRRWSPAWRPEGAARGG